MSRLRVAFAGHARSEDLGAVAAVEAQLRAALTLLKSAGLEGGDLIAGLAEGADTLAVQSWAAAGLGRIHIVFPYLDDRADDTLQPLIDSATWLDGARATADGRNPHLIQARWLIEDADLLMVVWTGESGRGAGGTADSVRLALERNIPVLWIAPGVDRPLRLIRPAALEADFGFLECLEQLEANQPPLVEPATPQALKALLNAEIGLLDRLEQSEPTAQSRAAPIEPEALEALAKAKTPSLQDRRSPTPGSARLRLSKVMDRTLWRTYAVYRRRVGGRVVVDPPAPPPASLAAQPGFATLDTAYGEADRQANRLGAIHRSQQVFQAVIMLVAALVGSAPAVWPHIKIYAVAIELTLALAAFAVWRSAKQSERARRWGEARRLAEQLRLERAAWTLGVSTRDDRRFAIASEPGRAAWRWRQAAAAPNGRYDPQRVAEWGRWAFDALLGEQIAYHRAQSTLNGRLVHRAHRLESSIFVAFLACLIGYVLAFLGARLLGAELPHWVGGGVQMAGTVTPAFGAASLALDAALAFSDQRRRNDFMVCELAAIADAVPPDPSLEQLQRAARAAIRLQISQEERWMEDTAHRHEVRA